MIIHFIKIKINVLLITVSALIVNNFLTCFIVKKVVEGELKKKLFCFRSKLFLKFNVFIKIN